LRRRERGDENAIRQGDRQSLVRPLPSRGTVEIEEDVMLDIGEDGQPVGYDIQHASTKAESVARLILQDQAVE
jgi:uncharacterized protein YuzE